MRKWLLVGAVVVAVFAFWQPFDDGYRKLDPNAPVPSPVEATSDSAALKADKRAIDRRVKAFVRTYYRRDAALFSNGAAAADSRYAMSLEAHTTESFVTDYVASLDIPQNQGFVEGVYRQTGEVTSFIVGGHIRDDEADRMANVTISVYRDGDVLNSRSVATQFNLVRTGGQWKIAGCSCDL